MFLRTCGRYIFGYCLVDDVSERDWQKIEADNLLKENQEIHLDYRSLFGYKEEIKDVNNLNMTTKVNGEIKQDGNTDKMIFP